MFSQPWMHLSHSDAKSILRSAHIVHDVDSLDVLCLAAGGGQQSAVFGLLCSRVTVLDFSERQLSRDREAASRYGFDVRVELCDMRDLSRFAADAFDLVWHAWSINYVPDPWRSFCEVARTLKTGGWYVLEFGNPAAANLDRGSWNGNGYTIREPFMDGAERKFNPPWMWYSGGRIFRKTAPRAWLHSLACITGKLSALGMLIISCDEYPTGDVSARPGSREHSFAYCSPSLRITARLLPNDVLAKGCQRIR